MDPLAIPCVWQHPLLDVLIAHSIPGPTEVFPHMNHAVPTVYQYSAPALAADPATPPVSLDKFRGQVLLIVNTASRCGFTPQHAGLETLYSTYKDHGFQVLGFPCNQFGAQEPGSESEIGAFCHENYRVTFPLFAKIDVNGPNAHPLYRFLKHQKPGLLGFFGAGAIRWNFTKFLIGRHGEVAARYSSAKSPQSLAPAIERLLDES